MTAIWLVMQNKRQSVINMGNEGVGTFIKKVDLRPLKYISNLNFEASFTYLPQFNNPIF